jgi:hypothetical protein
MGSFETDIDLPDLKKMPLKLSSVVLASQRQPATKKDETDPLSNGGFTWIPNVAHVFRTDQHLYLLYEVYDPNAPKVARTSADADRPGARSPEGTTAPIQVLTSIEFLEGTSKVFETPPVQATALNVPNRNAVAFAFDIPLNRLKPGVYICQVNIIDDAGGTFSFPRQALLVRPAAAAAASNPSAPATPAPAAASTGAPPAPPAR